MPHHTAANEGAIAAVFSMLRVELETELDIAGMKDEEEKPTEIRRLLRAGRGGARQITRTWRGQITLSARMLHVE